VKHDLLGAQPVARSVGRSVGWYIGACFNAAPTLRSAALPALPSLYLSHNCTLITNTLAPGVSSAARGFYVSAIRHMNIVSLLQT